MFIGMDFADDFTNYQEYVAYTFAVSRLIWSILKRRMLYLYLGFQTFFSEVGGSVGILLGFSLFGLFSSIFEGK